MPTTVPTQSRPQMETLGMVSIIGGSFEMGDERIETFLDDAEGPVRRVSLSPFLLHTTAVTNAEFGEFVAYTGYVSDAERAGWSFVFHSQLADRARTAVRQGVVADAPWWLAVEGTFWKQPDGPGSHIVGRENHPVVHVSWRDAAAYSAWAGKRLPSEAEWEFAARGGLRGARYPWGDEFKPAGQHRCNTWQGRFPNINTGEDGFIGTCPVNTFAPNAFGLYNMAGNVWEWCSDWWSASWTVLPQADTWVNPQGAPTGAAKVIRGGSYLCHAAYCNRYRVSARSSSDPASTTGHMGFRCAANSSADMR